MSLTRTVASLPHNRAGIHCWAAYSSTLLTCARADYELHRSAGAGTTAQAGAQLATRNGPLARRPKTTAAGLLWPLAAQGRISSSFNYTLHPLLRPSNASAARQIARSIRLAPGLASQHSRALEVRCIAGRQYLTTVAARL